MDLLWLIILVPLLAGLAILVYLHANPGAAVFAAQGAAGIAFVLLICATLGILTWPKPMLWLAVPGLDPALWSIDLNGSQTSLSFAIWVGVGSFVILFFWSEEGQTDPKLYGLWVLLLGASLAKVLVKPSLSLVAIGLVLAVIIGSITGRLDSPRVGQRVLLQIALTQFLLLAGLFMGNRDHLQDAALILNGLSWLVMTPWQGSTRFVSSRMLPLYLGVGCPLGLASLSKLIYSQNPLFLQYRTLLLFLFLATILSTVFLAFLGPNLATRISVIIDKTQTRHRRSTVGLGWWDGWLLDGAIIRGTMTTFLVFGEIVRLLQCGSIMIYLFLALLGGGLIYSELFVGQ